MIRLLNVFQSSILKSVHSERVRSHSLKNASSLKNQEKQKK